MRLLERHHTPALECLIFLCLTLLPVSTTTFSIGHETLSSRAEVRLCDTARPSLLGPAEAAVRHFSTGLVRLNIYRTYSKLRTNAKNGHGMCRTFPATVAVSRAKGRKGEVSSRRNTIGASSTGEIDDPLFLSPPRAYSRCVTYCRWAVRKLQQCGPIF